MEKTHFKIAAYGQTDRGSVRSSNQDAMLVNERDRIFIVADGMGGHAGGEVASDLCINQIPMSLRQSSALLGSGHEHPSRHVQLAIADATNFASTRIYEKALENPIFRGMGTTATTLVILDHYAYIGHVGDSRAYLVRCDLIYQMTFDHSLVSEQIRAGLISEDEAQNHHLRNVITRSVGYQEEEDVDVYYFPLEAGDSVILCSDGLHGKVSDMEISQLTVKRGLKAVPDLIRLANERGGEDNITCIIVQVT